MKRLDISYIRNEINNPITSEIKECWKAFIDGFWLALPIFNTNFWGIIGDITAFLTCTTVAYFVARGLYEWIF